MSPEAKKLLKEHSELCKEIASEYTAKFFIDTQLSAMGENATGWDGFVQKNTAEEKDWEIVEGKSDNGLPHEWVNLSTIKKHGGTTCEDLGCKIWTVKRLSDGEVFSVGDKVEHTNDVTNPIGIIESFHIMTNGLWFKTDNYDVPMCFIKRNTLKPLFTTEDGKQIFEGDRFYTVKKEKYYLDVWNCVASEKGNVSDLVYFSTEQAAKDYIVMNKPCLSVNDICERFSCGTMFSGSVHELNELAKQKCSL